jgi:RimJ/RimL family protein N-acetyltransferase
MVSSRWPLADLWLQTPELVLRWPSLDDLHALADLAAAGVHDPEVQPFMVAWTDASPDERARSTLQYHWSCWRSWKPSDWMLELAVVRDGVVVGSQGVGGRDFAVLREVHTGSWMGRRYQGQGIGTQMRAAVLALALSDLPAASLTDTDLLSKRLPVAEILGPAALAYLYSADFRPQPGDAVCPKDSPARITAVLT